MLASCSALPLDDRQGSPTQDRPDFFLQETGMSPPLAAMLRAKMEGHGDKCHVLPVRYQLGPQKPSSLHAPGSMRTEGATRGHKYRLLPSCVNEETQHRHRLEAARQAAVTNLSFCNPALTFFFFLKNQDSLKISVSQVSPKVQEAWYLKIISLHSRTHVTGAGMFHSPGKGPELGSLIGYLLSSFPRCHSHSHKN